MWNILNSLLLGWWCLGLDLSSVWKQQHSLWGRGRHWVSLSCYWDGSCWTLSSCWFSGLLSDQDLLDTSISGSAEVDGEHACSLFQIWGFLSLKSRGGENREWPRWEGNVMLNIDLLLELNWHHPHCASELNQLTQSIHILFTFRSTVSCLHTWVESSDSLSPLPYIYDRIFDTCFHSKNYISSCYKAGIYPCHPWCEVKVA